MLFKTMYHSIVYGMPAYIIQYHDLFSAGWLRWLATAADMAPQLTHKHTTRTGALSASEMIVRFFFVCVLCLSTSRSHCFAACIAYYYSILEYIPHTLCEGLHDTMCTACTGRRRSNATQRDDHNKGVEKNELSMIIIMI